MYQLQKLTVSFFVWFILLAVLAPSVAVAFGVSPGEIREERLVPGATLTRTVSLVQGNPEADLPMTVLIDSKDMRDWLSFDTGLKFVIPRSVQQFPFGITIAVPEDANLGNYSAVVRLRRDPQPVEGAPGGTVQVVSGLRIDINVTVGDDVIEEFTVHALDIFDIKEGDALKATARIENTGNVPTGPDSASFELFDKFGNVRLAFSSLEQEQFGTVPAFEERTIAFAFPIDLRIAPGQYRGHVRLLDEEGSIVREVNTSLEVRERTFGDFLIALAPYIGGVAVLLVILLIVFFVRRRRKPKIDVPPAGDSVPVMNDMRPAADA